MLQRVIQYPDIEQIKPGEWHDVLWHQYMNCVDSLRSQNASTTAAGGVSSFTSYPSWEGFEGNVAILESMCDGYGLLDELYRKKTPPEDASERDGRKVFSALTDLLKRKGVWKEERPYLGRI
jgi:hypothetical protein